MFALLSTTLVPLLLLLKHVAAIVPKVDTGYAVYIGNHSLPNTAAFLGIPYAEPPVGEQRFRAPVPLDTEKLRQHKKTVDATEYPDFCVQGTTGGGDAGMFCKRLSQNSLPNLCCIQVGQVQKTA
jgi:hypothetical protein